MLVSEKNYYSFWRYIRHAGARGGKLTEAMEAEIEAEYQDTNKRFHAEYLEPEPQNWFDDNL
jgi:hypothetical protein